MMLDGIERLLEVFAGEDSDYLMWWFDSDKGFTFYVACSDFFDYATADSQIVTPDDWASLWLAKKECAVTGLWTELWCARKRKKRPMFRVMEYMKEDNPAMYQQFAECGPERSGA